MLKKKIFSLSLVLCSTLLFSAEAEDDAQRIMNQAFVELSKKENLEKLREVRENKKFIENEFLQLNELQISNSSEIIKSSDTINIMMHPEFPRTVVFEKIRITNLSAYPSGSIVVYMDENNLNSIEINVNNTFKKGVVVLKYIDSNGFKKIRNILLESYSPKLDNKIYLTTLIKDFNQIKPLDVIKSYQKLNGKNPSDGSMIVIDGDTYRFIEDKVNGFITLGDKKFRIKHSFDKYN